MRPICIAYLCATFLSVSSPGFSPQAALADFGARPNSTNVTYYDWDHDRMNIHLSDKNLVLDVVLFRADASGSQVFVGEYDEYRVTYNRDSHQVVVINYLNGEEVYNYDFYEQVDSTVDEGYL